MVSNRNGRNKVSKPDQATDHFMINQSAFRRSGRCQVRCGPAGKDRLGGNGQSGTEVGSDCFVIRKRPSGELKMMPLLRPQSPKSGDMSYDTLRQRNDSQMSFVQRRWSCEYSFTVPETLDVSTQPGSPGVDRMS